MKWLFAGFTGLFLVVFQTVLLPGLPGAWSCFDLTLVLIVFVSLHFSHYMAVAAIAGIGCIMDSLSGAPFCLYTFSYIWVFLVVFLARQFVFQASTLFVMIISLLSVTIQQGIFLFSLVSRQDFTGVGATEITLMLRQVLWGTVMIPLGVTIIAAGNQRWQDMLANLARNRERKKNTAHG